MCDLHHGLANGIMLPYAMRFNAEQEKESFARMAATVGLESGASPENFIDWLIELKNKIAIPEKLGEVGVKIENLETLTEFAFQDLCHKPQPA